MLDRIDVNLEGAVYHVVKGKDEIEVAKKLQKKGRKWLVIIVLTVLVIAMFFVMIFVNRMRNN